MNKVLVDRELLLQLFRCWDCGLEVDNELAQLRIAAAQPAEAEGVEVVAWQQRYICPGEGPSCWQSADERTVEILRRRDDYELRQLVPLTALSAVTAERDRLREDRDSQQRVCIAEMEKANQLRAEVERYVPLHEAVQRAAVELPEGWAIQLYIERDGGGVELIGPDGTEDFATNNERLDYTVIDALEAAMAAKEA